MPYYMYIQNVCFPVTPGKMNIKIANKNKTVTLISEGEVNLIKSPGLTDISIDELLLPARKGYPFATYPENKFRKPPYYLDKLEKWKKKKKPVLFKLSRTTPNGKDLLWDTNYHVTIEDYEIIEDAEQGMDIKVKLNMKQYRKWGAKKLKEKKTSAKKKSASKGKSSSSTDSGSKKAAVATETRETKETAKTYTVKKGDTLYGIARKQLGDGSKWKSIYMLNKSTIEAVAKKYGRASSSNGHWIYPGTVLKLPS